MARRRRARVPDPAPGLHLGTAVRAREFGLVGYTMAVSPTVAAALQRLTRYDRLLSDALVVQLEAEAEATWVRLDVEPRSAPSDLWRTFDSRPCWRCAGKSPRPPSPPDRAAPVPAP